MLAKPRRTNEGEKRIKLVFIFDEMDKMEVKEQKELTNQLKNLFLERNTVFLLVTSKEFYYLWWEDRKVEDAVLASYFSWIKMIPLFTSEDTKRLLEGLISIKSLNFSEDEKDFVEALARYLTYRAAGIPRDIIRELQSIQQSEEDRLQPYLTDRLEQRLAILVYAEIQRVLEDLLKLESSTSSSSTSTGSISRSSTVSNASFNSSSNAGTVIAPEHIWLNEGRREQIKRGLYVLVEELLDQTSLEINADSEVFKKIREANFKMVLPRDFKLLLDGLAEQLKNIRIQTGPDSLFARYASPIQKQEYSHPEIELFCQEEVPQTQDDFQQLTIFRRNETKHAFKTLTVLPDFYKLTGRPMSSTSSAPEPQQTGGRLSESQILGKLNSNERVLRREALSRLRQEKTLISPDINTQLCRIFITERNSPLRLEAVGLIQGPAASAAIFQAVDRKAIDQCIAVETDPKLLQEFIRLIHDGATFDTKNQQAGTEILLQLLGRHKRAATNKNQTQILPSATLPEAIQLQAISALVNITDQDVLEQVLQTFDKNRDIPDQLLPPLRHLEAKAQHDLIELFLSLDFTAISSNTLRSILKGKTYPQLMYLWTVAVARKNQAIGQQELICLLQQKNILSTTEPSPNEVVSWLNSTNWDSMDQRILNTALTESPELLYRLERIIDKDKRERLTLASRAAEAARTYGKGNPTAPSAADNTARTAQANPALSPSATEPRPENRATTTQYRGNGWLTTLSALAMVAIYFSVRFDLPPQADLNYQLITRFLEVMYAYTGLVALGACIMLLSPLFIRNPGTPNSRDAFITLSIVLSIAVVCFVVQYHYFPLTITGWGETALVVLLMSISAVPTAVWYISKWDSSRRPVPPQN